MDNCRNTNLHTSVLCYFCNDSFDERFWHDHVQLCGSILEQCPGKCGVYVPRKNLKSHRKRCISRYNFERSNTIPQRTLHMDCEDKEIKWRDNVFSVLNLLRTAVKESEVERRKLIDNSIMMMKRLETIEETTQSMKLSILSESNNFQQRSLEFDGRLQNLDQAVNDVDGKTRASFDAVAYRLDVLQGIVIEERNKQVKVSEVFENEIEELKKFVAKESALISDAWDDQKRRMNDLKLELEMRCKNAKELEQKHDNLVIKTDMLLEELKLHSEVIEKQERTVKKLKSQTHNAISTLEELLSKNVESPSSTCECQCDFTNLSGVTNGRLLWRINRYKEKMTVAKEKDFVLYSPVFFNKEYGYALKMELYLNGRDRWRDRNIIGCLKVVEGPWDPLLDWPCVLRATVTLRDQDNPANNIRKIVKTKARMRDDSSSDSEKDSAIDMFIPHTTLIRYDGFTRNNVLFLDIQITEMRDSISTSSLTTQ
ncbi:TNF receptor-associated factor 5 [Chelonus insularis]|uniref:TNF receptor-associated factor 5 n=1 Tax=Chelonus insularis TaxID=460826 RepID=UPI00158D52F4|nr:TNF receptor-associated factor 5 [Chelonus insularis]